jgi:hypothetical protein
VGATGQTVAVVFYSNGVLASPQPASAVAEIGSTGLYSLTLSAGLATVGHWTVVATWGGSTLYREYQVTTYTTDELYTIVSGQVGTNSMTITVQDGTPAAVPGMNVNVYNSGNTVFLCAGTTDSNGQVVFALDAGTYKLRLFKLGIATTSADLTVSSDATQTATVSVAATSVTAPSTPSACKLFADFVELDGTAMANLVVRVENLFQTNMSIGERETKYTTDSAGHVEFDVVQGTKIRVSFISTSFTRELTVPATTTSNLLTLMGAATDPFVVVT